MLNASEIYNGMSVENGDGFTGKLMFTQQSSIGQVCYIRDASGGLRLETMEEFTEGWSIASEPVPAEAADPASDVPPLTGDPTTTTP